MSAETIQHCHKSLASALPDLVKRRHVTDATVTQITTMQQRLLKMLPQLQHDAERAPNTPQGKDAQRKYLRCRQNITRCEQAFNIARKQQMMIRAMLGTNTV